MGFSDDLLVGVAQHLDSEGVGKWRDGSAYQANEVGISLLKVPQTPESVIVLAHYPVSEHVEFPLDIVGVQFRTRGTKTRRSTDDLADAIFDKFHGLSGVVLGGITVMQVERNSSVSLGQDAQERWERSCNYYFTLDRPSPNRSY